MMNPGFFKGLAIGFGVVMICVILALIIFVVVAFKMSDRTASPVTTNSSTTR